jgi:catechol 2,3-dioxygenase-like lactoylglutathione lyase family enzyme
MIGRLHHVAVDCREPLALARFYSELLGLPITYQSDDWVVIAERADTSGIAFQLAPDHEPPRWPDPAAPQQMHFDVMVDNVRLAEPTVIALGARKIGETVYADPAGHPFCLVPRPPWAPPLRSSEVH